jgi:dihydrofolate reductase
VFEGDTYFPKTKDTEWKMISKEPGIKDDKNPYDFDFVVYEKITT